MNAVIKYPGAKWSYADWIVSYIPEHKFYVEPYFGSGAVYFNKNLSARETINDIDGLVVNFFHACREYPMQLAAAINLTPYSRDEYRLYEEAHAGESIKLTGDCVEDARRFAIRVSQSFGNKLADRCGWKNSKSPKGPNMPELWNNLPDAIISVAERLKHTQIENVNAIELIAGCNSHNCLIYADPPYMGSTRNNKRIYRNEMMSEDAHTELLIALLNHRGPVILSGYDNELYDKMLMGWYKAHKTGRANSTEKRTETIWMNFNNQVRLF